MKIILISTNELEPWGGSEELWFQAAMYYSSNGHTVHVAKKDWGALNHSNIKIVKEKGIKVVDLHEVRTQVESIFSTKYDLAILNKGSFLEGIKLSEYLISKRIPIISISHLVSDLMVFDDNKWQQLKSVSKNYLINGFVSNNNIDLFKRLVLDDSISTKKIINPIDSSLNGLIEYPHFVVPTFAIVSRIDRYHKGLDNIIQVLSHLKTKIEFKVNIYGSGNNEQFLESSIKYYNLENHVSIHGFIKNKETIWLNNQCLLMLSRMEGLPLSMIEAFIAGRIVIANKQSSLNDFDFIEKDLSYLIKSNNPNDIACEIAQYITRSYVNWSGYGKLVHKHVSRMYNNEAFYKQLDEFLNLI